MYKAQIRSIGNSMGVILNKETLSHLNVSKGDDVFLCINQDGVQVTAYDPSFEDAMASYQKTKKKYRNALRELAKR